MCKHEETGLEVKLLLRASGAEMVRRFTLRRANIYSALLLMVRTHQSASQKRATELILDCCTHFTPTTLRIPFGQITVT